MQMLRNKSVAHLLPLLFIPAIGAEQLVIDVPPTAIGRTPSMLQPLLPEGTLVVSYIGSALIYTDIPPMPGYELTSLSLYLGGFHGSLTGDGMQPGWHGTLNGVPIALDSMIPVLVDVPPANGMRITSDVPDQMGVGIIAFGRAHTGSIFGETDCGDSFIDHDCQAASQEWSLAYRAVFQTVSEPTTLYLLGLALAISISSWKRWAQLSIRTWARGKTPS